VGHKFGGNLIRVQTIFQNALNWPKLHSHHVSNFKDSGFSVFFGNVPSLSPLKVCFASWWLSQTFCIFSNGHTTLCTPPKILRSSCFLCSLSYFQVRNRYLASFPHFKIKFDADTIFWVYYTRITNGTTPLYLKHADQQCRMMHPSSKQEMTQQFRATDGGFRLWQRNIFALPPTRAEWLKIFTLNWKDW